MFEVIWLLRDFFSSSFPSEYISAINTHFQHLYAHLAVYCELLQPHTSNQTEWPSADERATTKKRQIKTMPMKCLLISFALFKDRFVIGICESNDTLCTEEHFNQRNIGSGGIFFQFFCFFTNKFVKQQKMGMIWKLCILQRRADIWLTSFVFVCRLFESLFFLNLLINSVKMLIASHIFV